MANLYVVPFSAAYRLERVDSVYPQQDSVSNVKVKIPKWRDVNASDPTTIPHN